MNLNFLEGNLAMRINKKVAAVVAGIAMVGLAGGTAFAYWTTTGTGTGSATTGASTAWAVTSEAAGGAALTPGGPTDTIVVHVQNPGSGVQHLSAVTVAVANPNGSAWTAAPGCSAADYSVSVVVAPGDVAAGATVNGTASIQMKDTGVNQDPCKGLTVPLYFVAS